jgi:hypothetical protein
MAFKVGLPDGFLRLQEFVIKLQKIVEKFGKVTGSSGKFAEKIAGALIKLAGN